LSEETLEIGKKEIISSLETKFSSSLSLAKQEIVSATAVNISTVSQTLIENQGKVFDQQNKRFEDFSKSIATLQSSLENRFNTLNEENKKNLESIRKTVDEQLQKTLEEKLSSSYKQIAEGLQKVRESVGEMQSLASNVGDLKKVFSNVKTRGIIGEIQLGAILKEILTPEQYEENVATVKNSSNRVEFAVKLPGLDENCVYLPIDSKFPMDAYVNLCDSYEAGDPALIKLAKDELKTRILSFGSDIAKKYISVPDTTDFAIMFLPTEGLYAQVIELGLVEQLQSKYKINIAGPSTMAALLNSLQMGFKTLAIQKRSGEVWEILGAVKTEFGTFEATLKKTQERLNQANSELEELVGRRTRQMQRKLKSVEVIPQQQASLLLGSQNDEV